MSKLFIKDKAFYKKVALIAVPIALQGLITTGVNMMDTIMIGAVGETQLSAVSLANQFINIFHIFVWVSAWVLRCWWPATTV